MTEKRVVLMGDGKIANDCLSVVLEQPETKLCAYVYHRDSDWSRRSVQAVDLEGSIACDNVNEDRVVNAIESCSPDLIINVNSFDILGSALLDMASDGAVNFHNGPLPEYRGMNIPTWAIFNGETEHGVTWHIVEATVDTGAILAEEKFSLEPSETAISLTFKCLTAGLRQFKLLMKNYLEDGVLQGMRQEGDGNYYRARDIPNDGYIDFRWSRKTLSRFVRSLTFRPFVEPGLRMRIGIGDRTVFVGNARIVESPEDDLTPGTVLEATDTYAVIAAGDAALRIDDLTDEDESLLAPSALGIRRGQSLSEAQS